MRIVIDMQGAQTKSRLRGIGRYTISLVKSLVRHRGHHEIVLAVSGLHPESILPIRAEFEGILPQDNIRVWEAPGPTSEWNTDNTWRRISAELIREAFLKSLNPDFLLLTSLFEGFGEDFAASIKAFDATTPTAVIFYDLIPLIYSDIYLSDPNAASWYHNKVEHLKRADLLLSISNASRDEAIEILDFPEGQVINISSAADPQFFPMPLSGNQSGQLHRFGLFKPYLMYSGATDWRKNHRRLISAYSKLPANIRSAHQLAFVGVLKAEHRTDFKKLAKKCGLAEDELVIIGRVSDEEINLLYNLCKLFVFPSWHEGFGLPVLEAMQCGRAVIGSNLSSIPEVIGRTDALFNPLDEQSIAKKIEEVLNSKAFLADLERYGIEQSKRFSWDVSGVKAIQAMEKHLDSLEPIAETAGSFYEINSVVSILVNKIGSISFPYSDGDLRNAADTISQNFPETGARQLLVDISELVRSDAKTGIQRVVRRILHQWISDPPEGWRIEAIYGSANQPYRYARRFVRENFGQRHIRESDDVIEFRSGDYFIGLDLVNPDVVVSQQGFYQHLRRHNVIVKFLVYDLLPILFPEYANEGVPIGHRRWLDVISQCDGAICISRSVASELAEYLRKGVSRGTNKFCVDCFHLGADIEQYGDLTSLPDSVANVLDQMACRPTFLSVGTLEPRKGQAQVLAGFEELWNQGLDINFVLVGKQGWLVDAFASRLRLHPELGKRLYWLDGISDKYLERIYAASTCLVAASYGEGFGLPLIEAARHGLPIIARDIQVFREVAGTHASYFSGGSPIDLARAIMTWLRLHSRDQHPKSENIPWLTWKQSADQLIQCINKDIRN